MPFVLDASTALAWHFEDELSARAEAASERSYDDTAVVPMHWFLEVGSALLKGERRRRTAASHSALFIDRLRTLQPEVDAIDPHQVFGMLLPLARAHRLSVYDAAYLELAERRGIALATLDASLAAAARSVGVELVLGDLS
jgi:predicted nucleic acid-binding protein